jgi:hypothetical protein
LLPTGGEQERQGKEYQAQRGSKRGVGFIFRLPTPR